MAGIPLEQAQQIVNTLKEAVKEGAELSRRVESLEGRHQDIHDTLASIMDAQRKFFESYQAHAESQVKALSEVVQCLSQLEARVEALEGKSRFVM